MSLAVWPLLVTPSTVTGNLFNPGFRVLATRSQVLQSDISNSFVYFLEFSAHGRVVDAEVRGDLLQPIPMLSVRLGNPVSSFESSAPMLAQLAFSCVPLELR